MSYSRLLEDKEAFLRLICDRWHQVYCEAIRRYDPNHLILGDRNTLYLQPPPKPWALHIMRRYLDVLSVNVMGPPETVYTVLEHATRHWNGSIHLADTGACVYMGEPAKPRNRSIVNSPNDWQGVLPQPIHVTGVGGPSFTEEMLYPFVAFSSLLSQGMAVGYLARDDDYFYFAAKIADDTPQDGTQRFATRDPNADFHPEHPYEPINEHGRQVKPGQHLRLREYH